ncbi:MAG: efflux transporter periplasmic adaptor subunit [Butyricimonas synergistica]|nr:MAG: efflux transporter periplasmic adaptor subunit [Butyricimonas synergistica]
MVKSIFSLALCSLMFMTACKQQEIPEEQVEFATTEVKVSDAEINESYSASIRGQQDVEIYPQVSGTISQLRVQEGQKVQKGEVLFVIDQVPYLAAVQTANANVNAAQAEVETAKLLYDSKKILFAENVVSEFDLSTAKNSLAVAEAALVVGTLPYRLGALVDPSMPLPLTTISDNARMFVYFSMTENQIRSFINQHGSLEETIRLMPPVRLRLNDGSVYDTEGKIESISGVINPQTGTLSVRSVFPNEKRVLFSGGVGNVIITHEINNTIIIPQSATYEVQDKIFAYAVKEGKVTSRSLVVEKLNDGNNYIVKAGLAPGDVIVTEGIGLLRDGMEITVKENIQ